MSVSYFVGPFEAERAANLACWRTDCVATAAAALDRIEPRWASRVDEGVLDLSDPERCLLGQVFRPTRWWQRLWPQNGFVIGIKKLRVIAPDLYWPVFACPSFQDAWIAAIADRLVPTDAA
jgi:hypothetical protein